MLWADAPAVSEGPDRGLRPLRVGLVVGAAEEGWAAASALVAAYLGENNRLELSLLGDHVERNGDDPLVCDCLILLGRPATRDARQTSQLEQYCRRGGSIVALGSARDALPNWPGFAEEVLGVIDAGASDPVSSDVEPADNQWHHPVLLGVEPFRAYIDPLRGPQPVDDATVLLFGHTDGLATPVAWVRSHRGGRVFYGSLGQDTDFCQSSLLFLLDNAVCWAGQ